MKRTSRAVEWMVIACILGCSGRLADAPKTVPVSGIVTVDGSPVANATVTLIPQGQGKEQHGASGTTDEKGKFRLFTANNPGAMPGSYAVTIQYYVKKDGSTFVMKPDTDMETMSAEIKPALPPKFANPSQTELKLDVPEKGTDKADFALEKPSKPA
ncbi:MAG: carboxypeptidase-like regulatory domain-containing protein [Planctomycetaceae bacterium]|nr:carboxypeptidase-like regulatory domain-containing protein [Planctomycetaceae bacterium]